MSVVAQIESILFVSAKALGLGTLSKLLGVEKKIVEDALAELTKRYATKESGLRLYRNGEEVRLGTNPQESRLVEAFMKEEVSGELTRPQLETLTIISYRQPVSKAELEQIRGVSCGLILRNLLMRGLIEEQEDRAKLQPTYSLSFEFFRFLGITNVRQLPEYEKFHADERVREILNPPATS